MVLGETRFLGSPASSAAGGQASSSSSSAAGADGADGVFNIDLERPYKAQKADVVAQFEERYVRELLKEFKGNVSAAARRAGIDRMSLHKILTRYDLDARELGRG